MKKRKQLKAVLGADIYLLQRAIEKALIEKLNIQSDIKSCYQDLGGLNNLGMFIHKLEGQDKPIAISKLQNSVAAEREYRFQNWQENYVDNRLAPRPFLLAPFKDKSYSWVTGEVLSPVEKLSEMEIKSIFDKLNVSYEQLKELSLDARVESLIYELDDNSKIKSILFNLVSQLEIEKSERFVKKFLKERELLLRNSNNLYERLDNLFSMYFSHMSKEDISFMYGLVHGDFKKENIMVAEEGSFKVVDLQYFTYGIRIWDLAFYYSKECRGFTELYPQLLQSFSWTKVERATFIAFYLVASSLHIKKKNIQKIAYLKLEPAIKCLSECLGSERS